MNQHIDIEQPRAAADTGPDTTSGPARIVVAVGGSSTAAGAVQWAVAESSRLALPVQLVAACPVVPNPAPSRPPRQSVAERIVQTTKQELDALVAKIWSFTEVLPATVEIGSPTDAILRQLHASTDLLVLGHRPLRTGERLLGGSTSIAVAGRSPVPTVVVPDSWVPAAHTTGPVVVGLSISGAGQHDSPDAVVLREAFLRARALKVPLVAVYAWEVPALLTWSADDVSAVRGKVRRGLESLLTPWRSEFDDVEVVPDPVMGRPDDAIAQAAEEAQLIVLGRHTAAARHGGFHLGSTTRSLLHHTEVPVLVVPARGSCQERPDRAQVPTWAPMF